MAPEAQQHAPILWGTTAIAPRLRPHLPQSLLTPLGLLGHMAMQQTSSLDRMQSPLLLQVHPQLAGLPGPQEMMVPMNVVDNFQNPKRPFQYELLVQASLL